jgi:LuxR family transcriptional regulator, maltose regulon positive regulatory protein
LPRTSLCETTVVSRNILLPTTMASSAAPARRRPAHTRTAQSGRWTPLRWGPNPPAWSDRLVRRPALVQRLTDAGAASVAVIVAPPGYGKSSLLFEWADNDPRAFAWLRLDAPGSARGSHGLDPVTSTLRSRDCAFVLVIDDAHLAAPHLVHELVRVVSEECADGSMVALSSRSEPALPLGRLRASQALVELRTADLALSADEAAVLLRGAGLELGVEEVQALLRRTEGWAAGLYLAALALSDQPDPAAAIAEVRGDEHRLAEYFRDEVLRTLPSDLREFAVQTAVLDELSGPACDAALERHGSGLRLAELGYATPLLRPLDGAHERYRWHALFRETLAAELRKTDPGLARALHDRASLWYQADGDIDRAIEHAVAAHDPVRTGDLLWAHIVAYVAQGRNDIVQNWIAMFTDDELAGYAPLALCAAHSYLVAGRAAEARHWAMAGAAELRRKRDSGSAPLSNAGFAGIEAIVAGSGLDGMAEAAALACLLEPDDSPWRPVWMLLRGIALHLTGHVAEAKQPLAEGADLSAATAPSVASLCLAQAAMIAMEENDWDSAAELSDRAVEVIDTRGLGAYPISALSFAARAAVRAHHGQADEAKWDLNHGVELLTVLGEFLPWYGAEARILLAHASLWLADVVGARTFLAEASRLARRTTGAVTFAHWFDDAWAYMDTLAETKLAGPSSLTIAELRILRFLPSHRSFREIAAQLGVSANTVKTQAHAVYRKLGAASRSEAVARAEAAGLLGQ